MEMPEGYIMFLGMPMSENISLEAEQRHLHAGILLKMLAEALEKGIRFEDCHPKEDCEIYGHKEMRTALKRFKEWK